MTREQEIRRLVEDECERLTGRRMTLEQTHALDRALSAEWYRSLDESRYGDITYLWCAFDCWWNFTRQTLKAADKVLNWRYGRDFTGTFVDVGGGIGASTVQILDLFPRATAVCTNVPGPQCEVADALRQLCPRFAVDDEGQPVTGDVVLAFEVLEHIHDPISFITPYLERATCFVDGSSFTVTGYGHWPEYAGSTAPKNMRRELNKALRSLGFTHSSKAPGAPKLWNNRPSVWFR